jgi:hypothetical protein
LSEVFVCKSSRLAAFLIKNNCRCFKTDLDNENQNYLIHLFDKDENLNSAMEKWQENNAKILK